MLCECAATHVHRETFHLLAIAANKFGEAGSIRIIEALERNSTIRSINLFGASFSLASCMCDLCARIAGNKFGTAGGKRLGEMLEKNTTITELFLWRGARGACVLCCDFAPQEMALPTTALSVSQRRWRRTPL